MTQGKIERWHQTLKNRILLENYYLPGDLPSLDNLTPADVYTGRGQAIDLERERIKRQTLLQRRLQHHQQAASSTQVRHTTPYLRPPAVSKSLTTDSPESRFAESRGANPDARSRGSPGKRGPVRAIVSTGLFRGDALGSWPKCFALGMSIRDGFFLPRCMILCRPGTWRTSSEKANSLIAGALRIRQVLAFFVARY
jgi:hypothetical protein